MVSQFLTLEMVRAEIARRAALKKQERARVKKMLRLLPGGKHTECESVGEHEQTPSE